MDLETILDCLEENERRLAETEDWDVAAVRSLLQERGQLLAELKPSLFAGASAGALERLEMLHRKGRLLAVRLHESRGNAARQLAEFARQQHLLRGWGAHARHDPARLNCRG